VTFLNKRAKFAGLASITLTATTAAVLFASQAAFATATPGDNGTVKVHDSSTPVTDHQNDPQDVCQFYLDGFGFDGAQSVTWYIDSWPPTGNGTEVLNGSLTMDANGGGYSAISRCRTGITSSSGTSPARTAPPSRRCSG